MDRLFIKYVTPQIKEIYHQEIIQEWRLNIDVAEYEKYMTLSHVPSAFKKIVLMNLNTGLIQLNQLLNVFLLLK